MGDSYQSFEAGVKVIVTPVKDIDGDCKLCHLLWNSPRGDRLVSRKYLLERFRSLSALNAMNVRVKADRAFRKWSGYDGGHHVP